MIRPPSNEAEVIKWRDTISRILTGMELSMDVNFLDENGVPYGIKHIDNKPRVVSSDYLYAIAEGDVPGHYPVRRFGKNDNVGTTAETLSLVGGLQAYPASAAVVNIVSTSVNDTAAGTGVQTVLLKGLDANYDIVSETITMNGTTNVPTVYSYLRLLKIYGVTVGASGYNQGDITVENTAGTSTYLYVPQGQGESHSAIYTVPAGQTFYMSEVEGSENSSKGTAIGLWARQPDQPWRLTWNTVVLDNSYANFLQMPISFSEKTDVELRAVATLSGAVVTGGFNGWRE